MQQAAEVLVVDDEDPIRITLSDLLRQRGYEVQSAASGEEALALLYLRPFDLLLADLKLPDLSGLDIARRVRERQPDMPVIILTGHGSLESALEAMHLGIFAYMLKTSSPQEVLSQVEAAITQKRVEQRQKQLLQMLHMVISQLQAEPEDQLAATASPPESWISIGDLKLSSWRQTAQLGNKVLSLTPTEFRILSCLAQQAGQVTTYHQIIQSIHGHEAEELEAAELVKPHIYHLRQKIEPDPANPHYILTVRGTGYLFSRHPIRRGGDDAAGSDR